MLVDVDVTVGGSVGLICFFEKRFFNGFFWGVLFVDLKFFEVSKCSSKNYAKVSGFLVEEFTNNNKKS